ncbi:MAG: type II secretion system F family protein [Actinomycetota bacterium]
MIRVLRRQRVLAPDAAAAAVAALAGSIRSGTPPALALEEWTTAVPPDLAAAVAPLARRVRLGDDLASAAAAASLGPAAPALARSIGLHARIGGSLPAMLDALAETLRRGAESGRRSRAATSGARLSGRLVAGLPLACIPFLPGPRALESGALAPFVLVTGLALGAMGLWWIGKLVPAPPEDDPAAALAGELAAVLRGGAGVVPALDALAALPPPGLEEELRRARRCVALGRTWTGALEDEGGRLGCIAAVLRRSAEHGLPAADALTEWAATRRAEVRTEFDRALQRAPVLMVVPLTVCVLPSFALLAFGPFLLGALQGG